MRAAPAIMDAFRALRPGIALALIFFAVGLFALDDYGMTWDEPDSHNAAATNLAILDAVLHARPVPDFYPWEMPGYHFVLDTLRGLFTESISNRLGLLPLVESFHLANLVVSSLSILLLYLLALRVGGDRRIALLAALTLALFPKFLGHAQNNPKDLPALFVFVLVACCVAEVMRRGGTARAALGGLTLGVALTTRTVSVFLPVILGLWLLLSARPLLRGRARECLILTATSGVTFLASWPYLWRDPWGRLSEALRHVGTFAYPPPVLYLGSVYPGTDLPWHYFLVSFLASTPVFFIALALLSPGVALERDSALQGRGALTRLALIWFVVLVLVDMIAPSHYDGVRHFLMIIPAFCLLVAIGADRLLRAVSSTAALARFRNQARIAAAAAISLGFVWVGAMMVRMHPYQDAYLNAITNALLPGAAEDSFEVEYWGNAYREGAEWLNRNAEPGAVVYVPWTDQANAHLDTDSRPIDAAAFLEDPSQPKYLMMITRKAYYDRFLQAVDQTYEPVFTVRRQKATLLKVFKNKSP